MQFKFLNVNVAFKELVQGIYDEQIPTVKEDSRAGKVIRIPEPVLIEYERPWERVLFNQARDANPFFHLFEALWMLAGRNDVATLKKYNSKIGDIASDDGKTFNGAYGYRWRHSTKLDVVVGHPCFKGDQLLSIIHHLKESPHSRRAVLQMWNVEDDLWKVDESKDVCCNTVVYFSMRSININPQQYALDITVTNRSNDLIWGCLGANYVHFTFLQEYMAAKLGCSVGKYYQFTNNLHVYEDVAASMPSWLEEYKDRTAFSAPVNYTDQHRTLVPLYDKFFDEDLGVFVDALLAKRGLGQLYWYSPFLFTVAEPMRAAFNAHKERNYSLALDHCKAIMSADWRDVCTRWIEKRRDNYCSIKFDGRLNLS